MEWIMFGAQVFNRSSQKVLVAYNHPSKETWAFTYLGPGQSTPWTLDIDGVRAANANTSITLDGVFSSQAHGGWWKVRNGQNVWINDGPGGSLVMKTYSDGGFGRLTFVSPATPKNDSDYDWPSEDILAKFPR